MVEKKRINVSTLPRSIRAIICELLKLEQNIEPPEQLKTKKTGNLCLLPMTTFHFAYGGLKNSRLFFNPFGTAWTNATLELYRTLANELYGALANTRRVCYQQNILRHRELGIITGRRLRFCSNVRYRHACRCQMPQKLDNQNRGPAQCRITWPVERLGETGNGAEFQIPESNERE
ncbi:hypothetical protein TNCV_1862321 [Trichonephila clavipes]|nr:hypothetical protein TNCV_1862321 [Trichonephila clavipes]